MHTGNYFLETKLNTGMVKLSVKEYIPSELKSIIILLHGMTEHMGRYDDFATELCDVGIGVVGFDLPGHGMSTSFGECASFGEGNWESLVIYISDFIRFVQNKYNCPIYIMGFSLGSFILREYLARNPVMLAGAIIVGTGIQPNIVIKGLECIVNREIRKVGFNNGSELIDALSFGQYNKSIEKAETQYDWLCSDKKSIAEYAVDNFSKKRISAGLFKDLLGSMRRTNNSKQYRTWNPKLRVLIVSGMNDPVGNNGRGPKGLSEELINAGIQDVQFELFPGRHDIFHECENGTYTEFLNLLMSWILE